MEKLSGIFVDGAWEASSGTEILPVINPYTEEPFGEAPAATSEDVDRAVRAAHRALYASPWAETSLDERISLAGAVHDRIIEESEKFAFLATSSMGQPYAAAKAIGASPELIEMHIESSRQIRFEFLRRDRFGDTLLRRRPVGVVAGISPWNTPLRNEVKKVIPALLAGCTVVLKSAPETPFGAARLVEICAEVGVPPGVVNFVPGGRDTGEALVTHPLVRKVAFTGSSAVGSRIVSLSAPDIKRLHLELGGKSAAIVLEDANLEDALPFLDRGIFDGTGQLCIATSRVLVARSRYDEVVQAMADCARRYVLGDPFDPATTMGPLVAQRQLDRVLGYIEKGIHQGAQLVTGGGRPKEQSHGYFVEPTVFSNVDNAMTIAQEEIFGPVVVVIPFDDDDEAVQIANDSIYGLGGAVYSSDPIHALAVARRVDSGYVSVNRFGISPSGPFGGVKNSGIGRENAIEAYDELLEYVANPLAPEFAKELEASIPLE